MFQYRTKNSLKPYVYSFKQISTLNSAKKSTSTSFLSRAMKIALAKITKSKK